MNLTEHAFGEFYRRESPRLWRYVYRVAGHASDADDIVQDAFLRVLRADVAALGDEDRRRYLFRVASHLMADRWRRAAREQAWLAWWRPRSIDGPREPASDGLSRPFAALKPRDRALLWLAYVEGEDHQHIADALGLARGSVKVLLSRARARLRHLIVTTGTVAGVR